MGFEKFIEGHPHFEQYDSSTVYTDGLPYGFTSRLTALIQNHVNRTDDLKSVVETLYTKLIEQAPGNWGYDWLKNDLAEGLSKASKKKFPKFMDIFLGIVEEHLGSDDFLQDFQELAEECNFAYHIASEKYGFGGVRYKWSLIRKLDICEEEAIKEEEAQPAWFIDPPTSVKWPTTAEKKQQVVTTPTLPPVYMDTNQSSQNNVLTRDADKEVSSHEMVDVAIVAALEEELKPLLAIKGIKWEQTFEGNEFTTYHKGVFSNGKKEVTVVAAHCPQMGMAAATLLSMNMIYKYKPKYVMMIGIAAGVKQPNVDFGDILVAVDSFDYGSGKIVANHDGTSTFAPDYKKITIDSTLLGNITRDHKKLLNEIHEDYNGPKPRQSPQKIFGPVASGAMVVANGDFIKQIKVHERKLIGIDMETYGMYYAAHHCPEPRPKCLSLKAVCDFADERKDDSFHNYAAFVSANFLYKFLQNEQL